MDFFNKAKKAAQEAAANVSATVNDHLDERRRKKEEAWREQVLREVPGGEEYPRFEFKPFQEWADQFEPIEEGAPGQTGMITQGVQHVKERARAAMLSQIEKLMTDNAMKTALEGTSKLFTPIEGQVKEVDSAAGTVLNAINGVLLSYRFGLTGNQEQFGYLRSVAVEMLVKAVDESILGCEDPDAKLMELEALICLKVQEKKIAVQAVVSSTPLFTLDSLTPSSEAVQGAIAENVDTAHVNQALEELQHFVKGFLVAQMDAIVTQVPARIAELLQRVRAVRESLGSSAKVTDPKLMLEEVERLHDMTRGKVQGVVSGMVKMLNALMMPPSATSEDCNN